MLSEAVRLGKDLIEKESLLDSHFSTGKISEAEVEKLVAEISTVSSKLRAVHLKAHVAQKKLLTSEQVTRYDALRGYGKPDQQIHHRPKGH